jgi:transcriptional regulator with XRE-family HTH domain
MFAIISSVDAAGMLRDARRSAGLTQREVARRAGVPQPTVARIESRAVAPRVDTLDRLLAICGRGLDDVERPGRGVDRTGIRELLRLTPAARVRLAVKEAQGVERLVARARRR